MMKNLNYKCRLWIFLFLGFLPVLSIGQVPNDGISFSAVVRNPDGVLAFEQMVALKISIEKNGSEIFAEKYTVETNDIGLINVKIGTGSHISGDISTIDWSDGEFHFVWSIDPKGGENYTINGKSAILSLPYALMANLADTAYRFPRNLPDFVDSSYILGFRDSTYEWTLNNFPEVDFPSDTIKVLQYDTTGNLTWVNFDSIPSGGTAGQALQYNSTGFSWIDLDALPTGGTLGQVLERSDSGNDWISYPSISSSENESKTKDEALTVGDTSYTWTKIWNYPDFKNEGDTSLVPGYLAINGDGNIYWESVDSFDVTSSSSNETTYEKGWNGDLGGYVFYLTDDKKHGLVATARDFLEDDPTWFGVKNEMSKGLAYNYIGAGDNGKTFFDWRLPTKKEVELLINEQSFVDWIINITGDYPYSFWTSNHSFYKASLYVHNNAQSDVTTESLGFKEVFKFEKEITFEKSNYIGPIPAVIKLVAIRPF